MMGGEDRDPGQRCVPAEPRPKDQLRAPMKAWLDWSHVVFCAAVSVLIMPPVSRECSVTETVTTAEFAVTSRMHLGSPAVANRMVDRPGCRRSAHHLDPMKPDRQLRCRFRVWFRSPVPQLAMWGRE